MKKLWTAAGVVIATFIITGIVTADDHYINTLTGLNIQFPSEWTSERVSEYNIKYYPTGTEAGPIFGIDEEKNDPPIDDSEKTYRYEDFVSTLEGCNVTDVSTHYIGDIEYIIYSFNVDVGGFATVIGRTAYIINDGNSTYLGFICDSSEEEANNALFEQILSQITISGSDVTQELPSLDTYVQNTAIELQTDHAGTSAVSSDSEAVTINFWDDISSTDLAKIATEKYNEAQRLGMHLRVNLLDPDNMSNVIEQYYDGVKTMENGAPVAPVNEKRTTVVEKNNVSNENSIANENTAISEANASNGDEEIGEGRWYIYNQSGTTEDWKNIIIYIDSNDKHKMPESIGMFTNGLDGRLLTFTYIDGELIRKDQLADSQIHISLKDEQLSIGNHKVECKQYVDNDESGEVVFYRSAEYEMVEK